jgi:uncharacterized protein YjgD (DUF1641 family)
MAKPISLISQPTDPYEEAHQQIAQASVDHAEAVLAAYETLQSLHDSGILELVRGMTGAKDLIIGQVSAGLNTPEGIRGMRNLLALSKLFANIDPDILQAIVSQASEAMEQSLRESDGPPSLLHVFKRLRSDDSRRALNAAAHILESIGRNLRQKK